MIWNLVKPASLALASLLLAACSSDDEPSVLTDTLVASGKALFTKRSAGPDKGQQAAAGITRAQVEGSRQALVRLRLEENGTLATAAALGRNGDTITYLMGTGQAVYLKNGIMTGTRGLGNDLMSLAVSSPTIQQALTTGQTSRTYRFLNSEGYLYSQTVTCTLSVGQRQSLTQVERSYTVTPISETCQGDGLSFTNEYLVDAVTGRPWQTTQWISSIAGRIRIEHLKH